MARPFPNTFEKDSPMTPQSAASNISYQTNVSRQKTKKWAEAKTVNYGGDDWGDDDEYDYDPPPPPPPPISKPTGPRQQGQGASSSVNTPVAESSKRYGDLPPLPGPSSSSAAGGVGGHARAHSFDADDEKRNFSSSTVHQPSPPRSNAPATRFSQITGVPTMRNPSGPPALSISTQQPTQPAPQQKPITPVAAPNNPAARPESRGAAAAGNAASFTSPTSEMVTPSTASDFHERRDFSPSAVVPPLTTRPSAGPQSGVESTATRFPARKSSLRQSDGPPLEEIMRGAGEQANPRPWTAGGASDTSSNASARSPTTAAGKALPFIRPADIYKRRMEEEREKERQSMDSSRPSLDSLGDRQTESVPSPASHQLRHKLSSESLGNRRRVVADHEDVSDSGRRLVPMLDTVTERKSEYGLEGVNLMNTSTTQGTPYSTGEPKTHETEVARTLSTSPKLPDLNRISGFGIDMFSHADPSSSSRDPGATPTTASTLRDFSGNDPNLALKTQPSLGFRSVVNQAFDTSVPQTPASGGIKRTDSESTGTTGISPIISRASSNAVPGSRQPEMSILEVVNEPNSPESSHEVGSERSPEHDPPAFKMGHRRDISAPSPGNSPARTPDLGTSPPILSTGHHAEVAVASPGDFSPRENESLQAPRPVAADREPSFRPSLPGGWTSYATTEAPSRSISRKQTPVPQPLATTHHTALEEDDLTPTTTKQSLPQSAFEAAVIGANAPASTGAALGEHDAANPVPVQAPNRSSDIAAHEADAAISNNVYSTAALDPRVLPKLEQAPQETQLRPDTVNRAISNNSSAAPTPPPKDTPKMESIAGKSGYFPSSTTHNLQNTSQDDEESDGEWDSPTREAIPIVNTGTPPSDDENERLREEIVKSLSPRPSDAGREEVLRSEQLDDNAYIGQGRESTYLPSEYDNYWASTAEDKAASPIKEEAPQVPGFHSTEPSAAHESVRESATVAAEVAPLSPQRSQQSSLEPPRPSLQNRFSWEASTEHLPTVGQSSSIPLSSGANISELPGPDVEPPVGELDAASTLHDPSKSTVVENNEWRSSTTEANPSESLSRDGKAAGVVAGVAAVGGIAAAAYAHNHSEPPQRRLSLAEEKNPLATSSSYPVSPTPPDDEHPARSPQPYLPLSTDSPIHPPPSTVSPVDTPAPQQFPPTSKLIAFKDIMAISSPQQRIDTFNNTRQYWASIDPGLNDWMTRLQGQYPEHAGATGAWSGPRAGVPVGSARSKLGKSGGTAPPLQQPYYQQYLNASSPTTSSPSTPTNAGPSPGPSFQPANPQGFAPAGSKLTSQQVQAKGKELLHTAGIFGGKAGKAGKGLLAKGKNRLRGAGGGDKTSPPPPKPKNERRSSWGLPLSLTRSSNRNDASSRLSKDSTPTPTLQRSRAATATSWDASAAKGMSPLPPSQSHGFMSGALPFEEQHQQQQQQQQQNPPMTPPTVRQVIEDSPTGQIPMSESDHDVVVRDENVGSVPARPAQADTNQPSGDSFRAAEALVDGKQIHQQAPLSPELQPLPPVHSLSNDGISKSDGSNSDEAHFFDASEEPTDHNDWVMVSPTHDSRETLSKEEPVIVSNGDNITEQAISGDVPVLEDDSKSENGPTPELEIPKPLTSPTTSIINRPRGSSYDYPLPSFPANSPSLPSTSTTARAIAVSTSRTSTDALPPAPVFVPEKPAPLPPHAESSQRESEKHNGTPSFLPPIRRTSTFGLGFGSRHPRPRFPIDDADDTITPSVVSDPGVQDTSPDPSVPGPLVSPIEPTPPPTQYESQKNPPSERLPQQHHDINGQTPPSQQYKTQPSPKSQSQQANQQGPMWTTRPPLSQASSSSYTQQSVPAQRAAISPPRGADILQRPEFRESQVEWRPNRPKGAAVVPPPTSPSYLKEMDLLPTRNNSWEPGAEQEITRQAPARVPETQYEEKPIWAAPPPSQQRPYEQPPSSAQRYPELFRPGQMTPEVARGSIDLPAQYYQAPIPRAAAFLPRQQTNEYQLQGVGPPEPQAAGTSRRNSGFFKEIGGRLSRASSRERRSSSISRRDGRTNSISRDQHISRGEEYEDSIAPSEAAQERQRKRSSFFGVLHKSTSGVNTPASRESVIAHHGTSRVDLSSTPPTPPSPVVREDKRKTLFGGSQLAPKPKKSKMARASTGSTGTAESSRKNRFSGLSSMFSKSSQSPRELAQPQPQATRELSHYERQPLESPSYNATPPQVDKPAISAIEARSASQSRNPFAKLSHSATSPSSPAREKKQRRPSASGLLNGFIGRKSNTDRGSDDSRSQGSTSTRTIQPVLLSQTYSDLNDEVPTASVHMPQAQSYPDDRTFDQRFPDPNRSVQPAERGRRTSKEQRPQYIEPQYDSVPIPGGYALVRGQGAIGVHTDYDPRGLNRTHDHGQLAMSGQGVKYNGTPQPQYQQQNRSETIQDQRNYQQSVAGPGMPQTSATVHQQQQQHSSQQPAVQTRQQPHKLDLTNISAYHNYQNSSPRLSREDLLARSPPKSLEGQQRPYQISLPGGDEEDERPPPVRKDPTNPSSAHPSATAGRMGVPLRLQQPTLRHPESPAGYPLPDDTVFSPVNPRSNDMPPPPPPKWPSHLDQQHMHERHQSQTPSMSTMDLDLDRSNTRRTAVSAISGYSRDEPAPTQAPAHYHQTGGLSVPGADVMAVGNGVTEGRGRGNSLSSPSPTPPSPMQGTPERRLSPEAPRDEIRRTEVHVPNRPSSQDDLYNASPRLPKPRIDTNVQPNGNGNTNANTNQIAVQTANLDKSNGDPNLYREDRGNGGVIETKRGVVASGKQPQEEKIHYAGGQGQSGESLHPKDEENEPAAMSATSYPGQEWNPYMAGGWDEGYD